MCTRGPAGRPIEVPPPLPDDGGFCSFEHCLPGLAFRVIIESARLFEFLSPIRGERVGNSWGHLDAPIDWVPSPDENKPCSVVIIRSLVSLSESPVYKTQTHVSNEANFSKICAVPPNVRSLGPLAGAKRV